MSIRTLISLLAAILITAAGVAAMTSSYVAPMHRQSARIEALPVTTLPAITVTARVKPRATAPRCVSHASGHPVGSGGGSGLPIHDVATRLGMSHLAMPYYPFDSGSLQISKD